MFEQLTFNFFAFGNAKEHRLETASRENLLCSSSIARMCSKDAS